MKSIRQFVGVLGLIGMLVIGEQALAQNKVGIAIIVNDKNPVDKLSFTEAKNYWLRRTKVRWPEMNMNILPANRKNRCQERDVFYSQVLFLKDNDVTAYLTSKQYNGGVAPTMIFEHDKEVIDFVRSQSGAIAFVSINSVGDKPEGIKVVLTVTQ